MKIPSLLLLSMSVSAFAGSSAKEVIPPPPAPDPCLFTWFAGGSVGYLTEFEEPMYHLHVGTDTCWNLGGWDVALFAEIGYTEKDDSWSGVLTAPTNLGLGGFDGDLDDLEDLLSGIAATSASSTGYDLDIMPLTFNAKLERPLTGNLGAYFGAGLGMALVDFSAEVGAFDFDDQDWVFVGQLFAGLNYNFTPNCEMYGGLRWIYFDDADLSDGGADVDLELDDDFLVELGVRYNF